MDDMTDEQTTESFIKAIEQLEWIAKTHHDTIVRVRELKDRIDDMPTETFGKYWLLDELEAALDGIQ